MPLLLLLLLPLACYGYKIAIVGSGIGGSSNAYFIRQLLGKQANITVFEKGEVGGRLRHINIGGKSYDSGGSMMNTRNAYSAALTLKAGLKQELFKGKKETMGLYDGEDYLLKLSGSSLSDKMRIVGRYGMGVRGLVKSGESMLALLDRIYCLQKNNVAFDTVTDLLNSTSPEFLKKFSTTTGESLTSIGISDLIQKELVTAIIRTNYNQGLEVNGLVGFVSLAGGLVGDLWRVAGGNYQLPRRLLDLAGVRVVRGTVGAVTSPDSVTSSHQLTYTDSAGREVTEQYDVVVLATPFTGSGIVTMVTGMEGGKGLELPLQRTVATFVNGIMAPLVPGTDNPANIMTISEGSGFSSIGLKGPGDRDYNYKVFSKERLTEVQLNKLFSTVNEVKVEDWWRAYPKYGPGREAALPAFTLAPGLFYINAIEWAASAIEMSCIGSQNVALLVTQHLTGVKGNEAGEVCRDNKHVNKKLEL